MSALFPTPAEYARMTWAARQRAANRLRELERGMTSAAIDAAADLLAEMPPEPDNVTAARRLALDDAVRGTK